MNEPYIETRFGKKFHFLNPQPDEICIEDIAYSLSHLCRFNGHCSGFYSVAEHSVAVAALLPHELRLSGLLHDAAEAYLGDLASPIKQHMPQFQEMESVIFDVIDEKFKLNNSDSTLIKDADLQQLCTESYHLIPSRGIDWDILRGYFPDNGIVPRCVAPKIAFGVFMAAFEELTKPKTTIIVGK